MSEDNKREILLEKVREFEKRTGQTVDSYSDDPNNTASVLNEHRYLSDPLTDEEAKRQMSARSRHGFLAGGVAALAGIFGWRWMSDETKAELYRRTFSFNPDRDSSGPTAPHTSKAGQDRPKPGRI